MLYWAFVEQTRYEHMPYEYKNDILLYCCFSPYLESTRQTRDHYIASERTYQKGKSQADKR